MTPRPPGHWRAVALGLAIFASGTVVGAAVSLVAVRHVTRTAFQRPELVPQRLARQMRRRLHLDHRQEADVARILADRHAAWLEIRRNTRPRIDAEIERLRREVSGVLTPRQADVWNAWVERGRGRWLPRAERESHRR